MKRLWAYFRNLLMNLIGLLFKDPLDADLSLVPFTTSWGNVLPLNPELLSIKTLEVEVLCNNNSDCDLTENIKSFIYLHFKEYIDSNRLIVNCKTTPDIGLVIPGVVIDGRELDYLSGDKLHNEIKRSLCTISMC